MRGTDGCSLPDESPMQIPSMGDLVLTLLAGTLSALRDRLACDGHPHHAEVVADLVEVIDDHLAHTMWGAGPRETY